MYSKPNGKASTFPLISATSYTAYSVTILFNSAYSSQQTTLPQIVVNDDDDTNHVGLEEDEVSVLFINTGCLPAIGKSEIEK